MPFNRLARTLTLALCLGGASEINAAFAQMAMDGAYGNYAMTREASGTAWQPDNSEHQGLHVMTGNWMLMGHASFNAVFSNQQGPRGGDSAFPAGMVMGMARRDLDDETRVQFRTMLSIDPFMGKRGYPILLASGETADGKNHLVDRQHPHDLVMELSASLAHQLSPSTSLFIYGGLPGEPAFGPPAFMHRQSVADSPEAPISHHWLDSTHVTFGVLTAGLIVDTWKVEVSGFKGREPDQYRFDIEAPALNSIATRLSWNPTPALSLQVSYADQKAPEQLEPVGRVRRTSASAIYTTPVGEQGWWSSTIAWGQKAPTDGHALDAIALESAIHPNADWTVFGRIETIQSTELGDHSDHAHGQRFSKLSAGVIRDFTVSDHAILGIGVLHAFNKVPVSLAKDYGSDTPQGDMVFIRLKII